MFRLVLKIVIIILYYQQCSKNHLNKILMFHATFFFPKYIRHILVNIFWLNYFFQLHLSRLNCSTSDNYVQQVQFKNSLINKRMI